MASSVEASITQTRFKPHHRDILYSQPQPAAVHHPPGRTDCGPDDFLTGLLQPGNFRDSLPKTPTIQSAVVSKNLVSQLAALAFCSRDDIPNDSEHFVRNVRVVNSSEGETFNPPSALQGGATRLA